MANDAAGTMLEAVDAVWRAETLRVHATLVRLLGDFERAEEALAEAFAAALERWPAEGIPASPRAWLVSAGRFCAIDALAPPFALRRVTRADCRTARPHRFRGHRRA